MPQLKAVVVPGILGSVLYYPKGGNAQQEIWGENFFKNYRRLIKNPSLLQWDGSVAATRLLKTAFVSEVIPWPKSFMLGNLLSYLGAHPDFGGGGTVECSYDWRDSIVNSAQTITKTIQQCFSTPLEDPPTKNEPYLVFFTHSMGGLVTRIAIAQGLIHPKRINRVIHIGAPLQGAPVAFRTLFEKSTLPLLREMFRFFHFFHVYSFMKVLLECFQSFPSVYQLMPPEDINYISYSPTLRQNPLNESFLRSGMVTHAREAHRLLRQAATLLATQKVPVYSIYTAACTSLDTDLEYEVEAMARPSGYRITRTTLKDSQGDGTVPSYSAKGGLECIVRPVFNCTHAFMCNSDAVVEILPTLLAAKRASS